MFIKKANVLRALAFFITTRKVNLFLHAAKNKLTNYL